MNLCPEILQLSISPQSPFQNESKSEIFVMVIISSDIHNKDFAHTRLEMETEVNSKVVCLILCLMHLIWWTLIHLALVV